MLSVKPWRLELVLLFCLRLLAIMALGLSIGTLLRQTTDSTFPFLVISTLSFHGAILVLMPFFLREHQTGWNAAFGLNAPRQMWTVLLAVLTTAVALPAAWSLGDLSAKVMTWFQMEPVVQEAVTRLQGTTDAGEQVYLAFMAVGMAPVAEELLFRGILYPFLKQRSRRWVAWFGTAILFGVVHFNLMTLLPLIFLGLVLAWLYEVTDNLVTPILTHSLFNLANFFRLVTDAQ